MKFECILCKYKNNKEECNKAIFSSNWHCPTLQNIYYGKIIKYQPFKTIQKIIDIKNYHKDTEYYNTFNEDYTENEDYKFIFGVISYDDLSSNNKPNLLTMNDLDIIYNKKKNIYTWAIEAIYQFESIDGKKQYLKRLLDVFTKFMKENGYNTEEDCFYDLFVYNNQEFKSLEDAYMNFKYYVNGYINS